MDIKLLFGIVTSVLTVYMFIPYIRDVLKKKTQPHLYTWAIWSLLQGVGAAAIFKGGGGYGTLAYVVGTLFCASIFLLSFKYGTKNIKKFDLYCLIGALIALLVYFFVDNPFYALLLVVSVDAVGYFPTIRKTFQEPYSETLSFYVLALVTNILGIFAIEYYSVTTILYSVTLFAMNGILCLVILFGRKKII